MGVRPIIADSARRHGVSDDDMLHAYDHPIRVFELDEAVQDILDHADELARRFETYEPSTADERDPRTYMALREAAMARAEAERSIAAAVTDARAHGYSWATIGAMLGTSGEAARQRYGAKQRA